MNRYILEFAAGSPDPVIQAVQRMIKDWPTRHLVLPMEHERDFRYQIAIEPLPVVFQRLRSREIASILLESIDSTAKKALLHRPHLAGDNFPLWLAQIDGLPSYRSSCINLIKSIPGIKCAILSLEDTIGISQLGSITRSSFPWEHWRLVEAAVADLSLKI